MQNATECQGPEGKCPGIPLSWLHFTDWKSEAQRGKETCPGALPDFQDGIILFQGLQEAFCPKVGDAVVGQPRE